VRGCHTKEEPRREQKPIARAERRGCSYADGGLLTPEASAAALLGHLAGPDGERTGVIWDRAQTVLAGDDGAPGPARRPAALRSGLGGRHR
jgi:hypothetical protein